LALSVAAKRSKGRTFDMGQCVGFVAVSWMLGAVNIQVSFKF